MRGGGKPKRSSTKLVRAPEGLQIQNDKKFYSDICAALSSSLGARLYVQRPTQIRPGRQCVYIKQPNSPTVQGREGSLPTLEIFSDARQSAWLVVEIESEYGELLMLKHVSLKLWQGATTDAAHLCFRAEWDVRDAESNHAQPHWNVHAPRGVAAELLPDIDFRAFSGLEQTKDVSSFADFEQAEVAKSAPVKPISTPAYGLSAEQMHEFHFAMASNWHLSSGTHRPSVSTTQEVVTWISSCALYIKREFEFVMGT